MVREWNEKIRIGLLCLTWYSISSLNNIINKKLLTQFPHPISLSLIHLFSSAVYLGPLLDVWKVPGQQKIPSRTFFQLIVPLGLGRVFGSVSAHVTIWKVPVSYAHTVKGMMPIFTVILSRIIIGEKHSWKVYLSLIPIICGVAIATMTEISFHIVGLISALMSTICFALQNIYSKKVLETLEMNHLRLLVEISKVSVITIIPFWIYYDYVHVMKLTNLNDEKNDAFWILVSLLVSGLLNFAQSMVSFTVLSLVSPLSYSVCTAAKRILVITISLLVLKNPVTIVNVYGMMIAILGVLFYNKVKLDARKAKGLLLPVTARKRSNLYLNYNGNVHEY
ncbi:solute carrier family 35 member E1-like [Dendronephthya gigantea]|uniref:solute carrier family 35 member E1-like n=1 Tax=Dendronephthya gigantea TaxID=151771 RepID=UPI00106BCA80|nr:solute carrier family 35 member E1-like [Dendronephthya gigantea]